MSQTEPTIGSTIRICFTKRRMAHMSLPAQVVQRIGPQRFHLKRDVAGTTLHWVERVTSWVNVPDVVRRKKRLANLSTRPHNLMHSPNGEHR